VGNGVIRAEVGTETVEAGVDCPVVEGVSEGVPLVVCEALCVFEGLGMTVIEEVGVKGMFVMLGEFETTGKLDIEGDALTGVKLGDMELVLVGVLVPVLVRVGVLDGVLVLVGVLVGVEEGDAAEHEWHVCDPSYGLPK